LSGIRVKGSWGTFLLKNGNQKMRKQRERRGSSKGSESGQLAFGNTSQMKNQEVTRMEVKGNFLQIGLKSLILLNFSLFIESPLK
jgi:hypothetical protein